MISTIGKFPQVAPEFRLIMEIVVGSRRYLQLTVHCFFIEIEYCLQMEKKRCFTHVTANSISYNGASAAFLCFCVSASSKLSITLKLVFPPTSVIVYACIYLCLYFFIFFRCISHQNLLRVNYCHILLAHHQRFSMIRFLTP